MRREHPTELARIMAVRLTTAEELASAAHLSARTIRALRAGRDRAAQVRTLRRLCDALGLPYEAGQRLLGPPHSGESD